MKNENEKMGVRIAMEGFYPVNFELLDRNVLKSAHTKKQTKQAGE